MFDPALRLRQAAAALLIAPIRFYRLFISPMLPPSCRFTPSCSRYAIEAIEKHGPLKGLVSGAAPAGALPSDQLARRFAGLRSRSTAIGIRWTTIAIF